MHFASHTRSSLPSSPLQRRSGDWSIPEYYNQVTSAISTISQASPLLASKDNYILPSVCCNWHAPDLVASNFLSTFQPTIRKGALAFQKYADAACNGISLTGGQERFHLFLNHTLAMETVRFSSIPRHGEGILS